MSKFFNTFLTSSIGALLAAVVLFAFAQVAVAQPTPTINYQGKLTDSTGVAVADGTYNMRFWLLQSTGQATTSAVWTEELTGGNQVQVTNGLFSVMLGSTSALTSVDFNQTLYLGVEVGGTGAAAWDGEMSPRKPLGTVPAAFEAYELGGVASSSFLRSDAADTMSASETSTLLTIAQSGTGDILNLFDGGSEILTVLDGGNVGIGTSTPTTTLQVYGDFSVTDGATSDLFVDVSTGRVGIGTDAPGYNLDVTGTGRVTGAFTLDTSLILNGTTLTSLTGDGLAASGTALTVDIDGLATDADWGTGDFLIYEDDGGNLYKVAYDNLPGAGGGITSLNTLTDATQGFATSSDTNLELTIVSSGSTHTFNPVWTGQLAGTRGGTGLSSVAQNQLLIGGAGDTWTQVATSALGLSSQTLTLGIDNQIPIMNAGGTDFEYDSNFTYDGTNLLLGVSSGIAFGGTRLLYGSTTNDSYTFGERAGENFAAGTTNNVAIGFEAGRYASTSLVDYGNYIGYQSGYNNTGSNNNFIGRQTGFNNTGVYNSAMNYRAGYNNRGNSNNIFGYEAGFNNSGDSNNMFGYRAGYSNDGDFNNLLGYQTGYYLQSTNTVAVGSEALYGPGSNYISLNNVALGYRAGYASDDGSGNNILLGYQAADSLTTGANNLIIGYDVEAPSNTADGQLNIGNAIFGTGLTATGTDIFAGNIGIGTTSPASKLDVWGDFRVGNGGSSDFYVDTTDGFVAVSGGDVFIPGLTFVGDTNTGLYSAGSDQIGFSLNGTENMRLTETGLGLGTSSPASKLDVWGDFRVGTGSEPTLFVDTSTGAVGIGTDSVGGSTLLGLYSTGDNNAHFRYGPGQSAALQFEETAGLNSWNITADGAADTLSFTNGSSVENLHFTQAAGAVFNSGNEAGLDFRIEGDTLDDLFFVDAGLEMIGIATDTPAYTLSVAGDIHATGALYDNANSAGTNGMVLQSDGAGFNWVATTSLGLSSQNLTLGADNQLPIMNAGGTDFEYDSNFTYDGSVLNIGGTDTIAWGGTDILFASTTRENYSFGESALGSIAFEAQNNVAIGTNAQSSNLTGDSNIAIGFQSLLTNTGNRRMIAMGESALQSLDSGDDSVAIGYRAMFRSGTSSESVAIGSGAGNGVLGMSEFDRVTLVGASAGGLLTTGDENIFIGYQAGDETSSGAKNIVIGYDIDTPTTTSSNTLNIGNLLFGTGLDGADYALSSGNIGIGTTSPNAKLTVAGDINIDDPSSGLSILGSRVFYASSTNDSIAIGESAGASLLTDGIENIAIGLRALDSATSTDYNIAIGVDSLTNVIEGGDNNIAIGRDAGRDNTIASANTYVGDQAGRYNQTGLANVFMGRWAGLNNLGTGNVGVGAFSLSEKEGGDQNTALGYNAGRGSTTQSGLSFSRGLFLGNGVAANLESGANNNIIIGYQTAANLTTGSNNLIIGYDIEAPSNTASNQLNIGNIIYGTAVDGVDTTLSTGNIGIGTTSPASKLDVWGDFRVSTNTSSTLSLFGVNTGNSSISVNGDGLGTGLVNIFNDDSTAKPQSLSVAAEFNLSDGASFDRDGIVFSDGYIMAEVGSATTSGSSLDVSRTHFVLGGTTNITGDLASFVDSCSGGAACVSSGNVLNVEQDILDSTSAALNVRSLTTSGGYVFRAEDESNDTTPFVIDQDGNIGIGTTSPASKLDVWGDFRVGTGSTPTLLVDTAAEQVMIGTSTPYNVGSTGLYIEDANISLRNSGNLTRSGDIYMDGSGYMYLDTDDIMRLYTGGEQIFNAQVNSGIVFNQDGDADLDFRIEGDTDTHLLFADAGLDRIGISTTTPTGLLSLDARDITGTNSVAGIDQFAEFENTSASAIVYGNRSYIYASNTATTTMVGGIIRLEDITTFGNTVRGLEVQTNRGSNTQGENTALSGFARTFGVRGVTSGDAGGTFEPAGGFFETEGTTQGNAIRGFSNSITTASLLSLFQGSSTFTGTGLEMNFGNTSGDFSSTSSKYLDFQNAGTSVFTVTAFGTTTIGDGTTNNMAGLQIGYGGICVDNDGSCTASTTGRITSVESQTGNSDLAEMYFSDQALLPGEVVVLRDELSIQRATADNDMPVLGVVSTKPGLTLGFDDQSTRAGETGYPLALKGRVPVRLSTENGAIRAGDALMLSSLPGVAMRADGTGTIVGIALEDFNDNRMYSDTYINQFGDDIAEPDYTPIAVNDDPRISDGCYYGGGGEAGETPCVPLQAETVDEQIAEANEIAAAEAIEDALDDLQYVGSDTRVLANGSAVQVGQIVMFVDRAQQILAPDQLALFDSLLSTSTLAEQVDEDAPETVFDRMVALADSFVAGVFSVFEIRADRVEVANELCVDGVCVTADDLRNLLDDAAAEDVEESVEDNQTNDDADNGQGNGDIDTSGTDDTDQTAGTTTPPVGTGTTTASTTDTSGIDTATTTATSTDEAADDTPVDQAPAEDTATTEDISDQQEATDAEQPTGQEAAEDPVEDGSIESTSEEPETPAEGVESPEEVTEESEELDPGTASEGGEEDGV